jgi:hypothetical protein
LTFRAIGWPSITSITISRLSPTGVISMTVTRKAWYNAAASRTSRISASRLAASLGSCLASSLIATAHPLRVSSASQTEAPTRSPIA